MDASGSANAGVSSLDEVYRDIARLSSTGKNQLSEKEMLIIVKAVESASCSDDLILNTQQIRILCNLLESTPGLSNTEMRIHLYECLLNLVTQRAKIQRPTVNDGDGFALPSSASSGDRMNGKFDVNVNSTRSSKSIFPEKDKGKRRKMKNKLDGVTMMRDFVWDVLVRAVLRDLALVEENSDLVIEALRVLSFMHPIRFMALLRTRGVDYSLKNSIAYPKASETVRVAAIRTLGSLLMNAWAGLQGPVPMLISLLLPTPQHRTRGGKRLSQSSADMPKSVFVSPSSFESSGELSMAKQDAEDRIIEIWKIIVACVHEDPSDLVACEAFKAVSILIDPLSRAITKRNDGKQLFHALKPRLDIDSAAGGGSARRLIARLLPQLLPNIRLIVARACWIGSIQLQGDVGLPSEIVASLSLFDNVVFQPGLHYKNDERPPLLNKQSTSSSSIEITSSYSTGRGQDMEDIANQTRSVLDFITAMQVCVRLTIHSVHQIQENYTRSSTGIYRKFEADNLFMVSNQTIKINSVPGAVVSSSSGLNVSPILVASECFACLLAPIMESGSPWPIYAQIAAMENSLLLLKSINGSVSAFQDVNAIIEQVCECSLRCFETLRSKGPALDSLSAELHMRTGIVLLECLKFADAFDSDIGIRTHLVARLLLEMLTSLPSRHSQELHALQKVLIREALASMVHTSLGAVLKFLDGQVVDKQGLLYPMWEAEENETPNPHLRHIFVSSLAEEFESMYNTRTAMLDKSTKKVDDHFLDSIALNLCERLVPCITWSSQKRTATASASFCNLLSIIFKHLVLNSKIDRDYLSRVTEDLVPVILGKVKAIDLVESKIQILWLCAEFLLALPKEQREDELCSRLSDCIANELVLHGGMYDFDTVGIGMHLLLTLGRRCDGKYQGTIETCLSNIKDNDKGSLLDECTRDGMRRLLNSIPWPGSDDIRDPFASPPPAFSKNHSQHSRLGNGEIQTLSLLWGGLPLFLSEGARMELDALVGDDVVANPYSPPSTADGLIQHEISSGSDPIHVVGQASLVPNEDLLIIWIRVFNMANRHPDDTEISFDVSLCGLLEFWGREFGSEAKHTMHGKLNGKAFMDWVFPIRVVDPHNLSRRGLALRVKYDQTSEEETMPARPIVSALPVWNLPESLFLRPLPAPPARGTGRTWDGDQFHEIWNGLGFAHHCDGYWTGANISSAVNSLGGWCAKASLAERILDDAYQFGFCCTTVDKRYLLFMKVCAHETHASDGSLADSDTDAKRYVMSIEFRSDSKELSLTFPYRKFLESSSTEFRNGFELVQHGVQPMHSLLAMLDDDVFNADIAGGANEAIPNDFNQFGNIDADGRNGGEQGAKLNEIFSVPCHRVRDAQSGALETVEDGTMFYPSF